MMKDLLIKCKKDNEFSFGRNVEYSCGCDFLVNKEDIYSICFPDYDGEEKRQYYVMCPNCGYINMINEAVISEETRKIADDKNESIPFLYRMNNLKSELLYLESIEPKRLVRRR